jgi:hypothetical protein
MTEGNQRNAKFAPYRWRPYINYQCQEHRCQELTDSLIISPKRIGFEPGRASHR